MVALIWTRKSTKSSKLRVVKNQISIGRLVSVPLVALLITVNGFVLLGTPATATGTVTTYSQSAVINPPPAGSFTGSAGGDAWSVSLSRTNVYMVFHGANLTLMCRVQATAASCPGFTVPALVTNGNGGTFKVGASPKSWIDDANQKLYIFATQASNTQSGVVCVDLSNPASLYCGFTPLAAAGDASTDTFGGISVPVQVGTKWYAFNTVSGVTTGQKNSLMCFDMATMAACSGEPYAIDYGITAMPSSVYYNPGVLALGAKIIVSATGSDSVAKTSCFDTVTQAECAGNFPFTAPTGASGTPYPTLDSSGTYTGFCYYVSTPACFDLTGASVAAPTGMASILSPIYFVNGNGYVVLGTHLYVPYNTGLSVKCFDFASNSGCANFPHVMTNMNLFYSVNFDPFEPTCLWAAADNGSQQIQSFDAYTGGLCGSSGIIVPLSTFVNPDPVCQPATYSSLTITDPAPSAYTGGTVQFLDSSGNPISSIATQPIDSTGSVDLSSLGLESQLALPQVKIELPGAPAGTVSVSVSWTATYDTACTTNGQIAVDPSTVTTTTTTTAPTTTTTAPGATTTTTAPTTTTTQPLAFTGSNTRQNAMAAVDMLAGGFVAMLFVRRRKSHS